MFNLFQKAKVEYKTDAGADGGACNVQVQKELSEAEGGGLIDAPCGEAAPKNYAGYCK